MSGASFEVSEEYRGKFILRRIQIRVPNLPESFRSYKIVQLTDLHRGPATSTLHLEDAIRVVKEISPNLILLTGDYVQNCRLGLPHAVSTNVHPKIFNWLKYRRAVRVLAQQVGTVLAQLQPPDGMLAVLGNHDYLEGAGSILRTFPPNVQWLTNKSTIITKPEGKLFIAGVDDVRRGRPDPKAAFADLPNHKPFFKLLITHNPDLFLDRDADCIKQADLVAVGHTHGGQICLPFWGPVLTRTKQKHHTKGLSHAGKTAVYTNSGVGYGAITLRVLCPPEIAIFEFVA